MNNDQRPENWYNSLLVRIRPYQFNWIGRTKEGVNRWIGAPKGPSERICNSLMGYGIAMSLAGLIATAVIMMHLEGTAPLTLLAIIGTIHGVVFSVLGLWLRKMRRKLAKLKTVEELADEFSSTPEAVQRLVAARSIRARININDNNLYNPEEFVASRSLLRAASSPFTSETLLRAAQPSRNRMNSDLLLHPAEPEPVALTPIQQLFFGKTEENEEEQPVQRLGR